MKSSSLRFYVALQSTGIVEVNFDPEKFVNEALSIVAVNTNAGHMPGWLTSFDKHIYSISRTGYPDGKADSGGVFAFRQVSAGASYVNGSNLLQIDQTNSNGNGGVHCEVSPDGKTLVATNITASTVSIYQLSENGTIGMAPYILDYGTSDPDKGAAHPHQAIFDPSGDFLIVPLRTLDRVDVYYLGSSGSVTLVRNVSVPILSGPRHVAFNGIDDSNTYMYLLSEKDNSIRVFTFDRLSTDSPDLSIELVQVLSAMGKDLPLTSDDHKDLAAEVAVSNDSKFVYVSNRNLTNSNPDVLTIYAVNRASKNLLSHLTYTQSVAIPGKHPRMFALSNDQDNKWLAIANQFSQDVVVYERDPRTGLLKDIRGRLSVKAVVPYETVPDKVSFSKTLSIDHQYSREELQRGRAEGPMCVLWK